MSIQKVKQFCVSERDKLVEGLWDAIAQGASSINLTSEYFAELDIRLNALELEPRAGTSWEKARERILSNL